jgi:Extensin-like protein C-terminus
MPQPPQFFTTLAGVPVRYDRAPLSQYGSRGVPFRFHSVPDFTAKMEAFFDELWRVCPLGRAEVITSAGAFTNKPGQHGKGRAFDLDGIFWSGKTFVTLHDGFNARDRKFYFGVECVLRKHFGLVLNYLYNADHRDHFHFDDGVSVGFRQGSRSTVGFLQGTLRFVHGIPVTTDGAWGPNTRDATRTALQQLGISGFIDDRATWLAFLTRSAAKAFGVASPFQAGLSLGAAAASSSAAVFAPAELAAGTAFEGRTPEQLLHGVYEVLRRELGETALRKPVESALDQFANHPETVAWLESRAQAGGIAPAPAGDVPRIRLASDNGAAALPAFDPAGGDGDFGL